MNKRTNRYQSQRSMPVRFTNEFVDADDWHEVEDSRGHKSHDDHKSHDNKSHDNKSHDHKSHDHKHDDDCHEHKRRWCALDDDCKHPTEDATVAQAGTQTSDTVQESDESILIIDSCDIQVTTTDTKAAVNLQVALQLAIIAIISVSIASSERAEKVVQDLLQRIKVKQVSEQKLIIENSRKVTVSTTDTQASVNIQLLLQVLLALVAKIEVL